MAKYLVGFRNFTAKKNNKNYTVAYLLSDASAADVNSGVVGQKSEEVFLPENLTGMFKDTDIGKQIDLTYEINGHRAYLSGVNILEKK